MRVPSLTYFLLDTPPTVVPSLQHLISGGEEQTLAGCDIQGLEAERLQSEKYQMSMRAAEVIWEQKEVIASQSSGSQC